MNLETNFQMLDEVNKYAECELNFSNFNVNIYCPLEKSRPRSG